MSLNFDAKITLDVSQFLASVTRAETAIKRLEGKIRNVNGLKVPGGAGSTGKTASTTASMNVNIAPALGQLTRLENRVKEVVGFINNQKPTLNVNTNPIKNRQNPGSGSPSDTTDSTDTSNAHIRAMARERYAYYDVAAAYTAMSAIGVKALKAMTMASAEYERAFANIERTTVFTSIKVGEAASVMKEAFKDLAEQIPMSFKDLAEIGTIGNQLGIAQGKLVNFTKTVAEFSSITGVGVESAALSFGRIGELLSGKGGEADYNKLGSAIAYAGVKAVATEAQILSVTKEIATTAKMAKFGTADVVGLATALSSLGIAPEAARGSVIRTFAGINQAVGQGGDALKKYADIAHMTSSDFAATWKTNGQVAFDALLK